jgi:hypothetical protein
MLARCSLCLFFSKHSTNLNSSTTVDILMPLHSYARPFTLMDLLLLSCSFVSLVLLVAGGLPDEGSGEKEDRGEGTGLADGLVSGGDLFDEGSVLEYTTVFEDEDEEDEEEVEALVVGGGLLNKGDINWDVFSFAVNLSRSCLVCLWE